MDARRCKRSKPACLAFEKSLAVNLDGLRREIIAGIYRPAPLRKFTICEPKERVIHAPSFRDLVVQHAIYRIVWPIFDATFIDHSYACRPGYGTHKCADYVQQALRRSEGYTLHLDVRKYFYSIDRGLLRKMVERKVKDDRLVDVMVLFAGGDSGRGIPIGNLLSQMYALIYLNPIDHFIKRELRVARYARYMDDMLLVGLSREECDRAGAAVERELSRLGLELSKASIAPISRGVNFVGYRTWRSRRFVRKHSLYTFRRAVKRGDRQRAVSVLGHARHTSSLRSMLLYAREENYELYLSLPAAYRSIVS